MFYVLKIPLENLMSQTGAKYVILNPDRLHQIGRYGARSFGAAERPCPADQGLPYIIFRISFFSRSMIRFSRREM